MMSQKQRNSHAVLLCLVVFFFTSIQCGPMSRKARAEAAKAEAARQATNNVVNMEIDPNVQPKSSEQVQDPPPADNVSTDDTPSNQEAESVANEEQPLDESVQDEAASNEKPADIPREEQRKEDEIDWGHTTDGWNENVEQQQPDAAQQQQQAAPEQQTDEQVASQEGTHQNDEGVGVMNPEEVMHGDEVHGDHHGDSKAPSQEDLEAEKLARQAAEKEELQILQPQIKPNVHDGKARTAAEFMKGRQFGSGDIEEIVHGGHHVHGEENEKGRGQVQAGDIEAIAHGLEGVPEEKDTKVASTLDPEELMHAGQGAHDHNPHHVKDKPSPGLQTPEGTSLAGQTDEKIEKVKVEVDKDDIGPNFEKAVHGSDADHVHGHSDDDDKKPRKKVRYQDIIDLGLNKELLKGIDLSGLLEQEKREFEEWQKDAKANSDAEGLEDGSYWQEQVKELRKHYLEKLYSKVRQISQPDLENAEWDEEDDYVRGLKDPNELHEGESQVEHEMEMWASTAAKGHRQPHMAKFGRRGMNEEEEGEEGDGKERNGDDDENHNDDTHEEDEEEEEDEDL